MRMVNKFFSTLRIYPTMIIALVIIVLLIGTSIATIIAIPLSEAKRLWQTSSQAWEDTAKRAAPVWTNWFRGPDSKLPGTITMQR